VRVVHIAAGCEHSAAIDQHGQMFTWGHGEGGRLGLGSSTSQVFVPTKVACVPLMNLQPTSIHCGDKFTVLLAQPNPKVSESIAAAVTAFSAGTLSNDPNLNSNSRARAPPTPEDIFPDTRESRSLLSDLDNAENARGGGSPTMRPSHFFPSSSSKTALPTILSNRTSPTSHASSSWHPAGWRVQRSSGPNVLVALNSLDVQPEAPGPCALLQQSNVEALFSESLQFIQHLMEARDGGGGGGVSTSFNADGLGDGRRGRGKGKGDAIKEQLAQSCGASRRSAPGFAGGESGARRARRGAQRHSSEEEDGGVLVPANRLRDVLLLM
jgi:hypothetical protein